MKIAVGDARLFFDVDGAKIVPTDDGFAERPTVVVLHAGPGADRSLHADTIGRRLSEVAQVVYVHQRGDGRGDGADASPSDLAAWAEELRAFLDELEIERPVLLGTSAGALVALAFASRYPERPASLVLAGLRDDQDETIAAIRCPVLLLAGEDDPGTDELATWVGRGA